MRMLFRFCQASKKKKEEQDVRENEQGVSTDKSEETSMISSRGYVIFKSRVLKPIVRTKRPKTQISKRLSLFRPVGLLMFNLEKVALRILMSTPTKGLNKGTKKYMIEFLQTELVFTTKDSSHRGHNCAHAST